MSYWLEVECQDESKKKHYFEVNEKGNISVANADIYDNRNYTIKLFEDQNEIHIKSLYICGNEIDLERKKNTFEGYFGYINISVDSDAGEFSTGTIHMMPEGDRAKEIIDQLHKMICYIVIRSKEIGFPKDIYDLMGIDSEGYNRNFTTEDLFKDILMKYEKNFPHFYNNSKAKLTGITTIDSIEKLKNFSQDTARFIVTHPQYLTEVKESPIEYKGKFFSPLKTLVRSNRKNFDIYENRVIIGFLEHLISWKKENEYVLSFRDVFKLAKEKLDKDELNNDELEFDFVDSTEFHRKFQLMNERYKKVFGKIKNQKVDSLPQMTHIFKSVNHYNEIYRCMKSFFSGGITGPEAEAKARMRLDTSSNIYEYYVFLKLDEEIIKDKYEMTEIIPSSDKTPFPECFCYEKGSIKKFLYFRPEILFKDNKDDNGINLRRNTNATLSGRESNASYCPDFIIKTVDGKNESYEIIDAKFSDFNTVMNYHRPDVAFKYLLSVNAIGNAKIDGLRLCYCKGCKGTEIEYDPTIIDPYIKITALP